MADTILDSMTDLTPDQRRDAETVRIMLMDFMILLKRALPHMPAHAMGGAVADVLASLQGIDQKIVNAMATAAPPEPQATAKAEPAPPPKLPFMFLPNPPPQPAPVIPAAPKPAAKVEIPPPTAVEQKEVNRIAGRMMEAGFSVHTTRPPRDAGIDRNRVLYFAALGITRLFADCDGVEAAAGKPKAESH